MKKLLLFLGAIFLLLFASCNPDLTRTCLYKPKVIDANNNFTNNTKELFLNYEFPFGVYPVLYYLDNVENDLEIGAMADKIFKKLSKNSKEYPFFQQVGFLVVVSDDPNLIQVRIGNNYKTYCNLAGITSGKEYLELQEQFLTDDHDKVLGAFLKYISQRVQEFNDLPRSKMMRLNGAISSVETILDFIGTPSENLYGKVILKPILSTLTTFFCITRNWIGAVVLLFALLGLLSYGINKLIESKLKNNINALLLSKAGVAALLKWLFPIVSIGAACVLSRGRMEDLIALHAMGIPFLDNVAVDPESLVVVDSLWVVVLFAALWTIKLNLNDKLFLSLFPSEVINTYFKNVANDGKYNPETEDSETHYITEASSQLGDVAIKMISLTFAAYALLPKLLVWVGIFYAAYLIVGPLRGYIKQYKRIKERAIVPNIRLKLGFYIVIMTLFCAAAVIFLPKTPTLPSHKEVDYSTIKNTAINTFDLPGNYTFIAIAGEEETYSSAILKKVGYNQFSLTINTPTSPYPLVYLVEYDEQKGVLHSEDIGTGTIHYNRKLGTVKISFIFSEKTRWEISK